MSFLSRIRTLLKLENIEVIGPPEIKYVVSREGMVSRDFIHGIEILNDDTTTMEFVENILMNHFEMKRLNALIAIGVCHAKGSVILPVSSREQAEHLAQLATTAAREHNCSLVCMAISAQQGDQA